MDLDLRIHYAKEAIDLGYRGAKLKGRPALSPEDTAFFHGAGRWFREIGGLSVHYELTETLVRAIHYGAGDARKGVVDLSIERTLRPWTSPDLVGHDETAKLIQGAYAAGRRWALIHTA